MGFDCTPVGAEQSALFERGDTMHPEEAADALAAQMRPG